MEILIQRGNNSFLVEVESKYYLLDTATEMKWEVDCPDQEYRYGYCEDPYPTEEQIEIIKKLLYFS